MDIKEHLLLWLINSLMKSVNVVFLIMKQLAEESDKIIIKKILKRRAYSSFKDNIWSAHSADIRLISKFNKRTRFLLCVIDIFSKYA